MSNKDVEQQINWNVNQIAKKIRLLKAIARDGDLDEEDIDNINEFVCDELNDLLSVVKQQAKGEFEEPEFNIQDK